jgi:hypothetical protein
MTTTNPYNTPSLDDDDYLGTTITISSSVDSASIWGTTDSSILTNGSNGLYWNDLATTSTISIGADSKAITVKGEAEFEHDITIKGVKLMETLEKIESRLNILKVDPQLEGRWDELRKLGDAYRALEANILSKERLVNDLMKDYHND